MTPVIPKNSIVLITGVNGYIASNIADQLLGLGYRVRGTTRNPSNVEALTELFERKYGPGKFETVIVKDLAHEGAFDEAIKGVSGVAHVATNVTLDVDPNKVIPGVLTGINGILKSAAKEPSVVRFVYTSSSSAATHPIPNKEFAIDSSTWCVDDIEAAWAPPPYTEERAWAVYGASKAQAEQALWQFVKEEKPHFVANSILPNWNLGTILAKSPPTTTGWWTKQLFDGNLKPLEGIPPQWFIDVQDSARLHVACLINPNVENERIFGFAETFTFNQILGIFRKLRPDQKFVEDFAVDGARDLSRIGPKEHERAVELLKALGRPGFTPIQESIKNLIEDW